MKEIKSVRVRRKFASTDENLSGLSDYKVTLFDNGRNKFKVGALQTGKVGLFAEYKREGIFKEFSNDDFIKDGINVLISKQNDNKEFEIIQDPWLEKPPKWRSFGFTPYYLNNGSEVYIKWLEGTLVAGGRKWSDDDGNELSVSKSGDSKSFIEKSVEFFAPSSYEGQKVMKLTSEGIKSKTDQTKDLIFTGNVSDKDILNLLISKWNIKIPNYNLSVCDPDYIRCEIIPYISPVDDLEDIDEKLEKPENPIKSEKLKLNVILPKDLQIRVKEDLPSFKIFVGDPPKTEKPVVDGFDFGDEDDLSDLLLEDEFREEEFNAEEESPSELREVPPEESRKNHAGEGISKQDEFIPVTYSPGKMVDLPKTYSHTKNQGYNILNNQWVGNLITSAKSHVGTPTYDVPGTQKGNLGCAAGVSIIFYRAFGVSMKNGQPVKNVNSIGSFGSLSTAELNTAFKDNPGLYSKRSNWRDAQPGDILNTGRNFTSGKAGHIGIVIDEKHSNGSWTVVSNSSSGFAGGGGGAIKRNYSVKAWEDVAKRNPSETFAYVYIGPSENSQSV
jgi:hypothetical protein